MPLKDATSAIIVGKKNHEYLFSVKLSKTFCIKKGYIEVVRLTIRSRMKQTKISDF